MTSSGSVMATGVLRSVASSHSRDRRKPGELSRTTRTLAGSTSMTVSMAVENVAVVSRTSSESPITWTKNPSVACSTDVTSHSASRTSTTEPGAAVKGWLFVFGSSAVIVTSSPVGGGAGFFTGRGGLVGLFAGTGAFAPLCGSPSDVRSFPPNAMNSCSTMLRRFFAFLNPRR